MRLLGLDGWSGGWVCVSYDTDTKAISGSTLEIDALAATDFQYAAIDVPIGLSPRGPREADVLAKAFVGKRHRSVFRAPVRAALHVPEANEHEATVINALLLNGAVSKQAFAIFPKIREVDAFLHRNPTLLATLKEVHPEVTFRKWAREELEHKTTTEGARQRRELIGEEFGQDSFATAREQIGRGPKNDDIADAFAALWTARRIAAGDASKLPNVDAFDSCGFPMQIWY